MRFRKLMRAVHFTQRMDPPDLARRCHSKVAGAILVSDRGPDNVDAHHLLWTFWRLSNFISSLSYIIRVRNLGNIYCGEYEYVWRKLITHIHGSSGPFSQLGKHGGTSRLYILAMQLFPHGPPIPGIPRIVSCRETAQFAKPHNRLFRKNGYIVDFLLFPQRGLNFSVHVENLVLRVQRSYVEVAK